MAEPTTNTRRAQEIARFRGRVVFDRPIGKHQAIQHPLAANWVDLEAAHLLMMKAAWLYDNGKDCGAEANAAKYFSAEAGFRACEQAILTHGGMGYSKEFYVERYLREIMIPRIAPVSREVILSHITRARSPEVVLRGKQRSRFRLRDVQHRGAHACFLPRSRTSRK
ncbi:hypothetical protein AYJ54_37390 [Bradyrhizobium centrolobii]|uniref:Acyl-CoA dehydrogenase/oxidase C-terminal domain-containing protein n=1 Tax=Bradyrhizobium centrolobii TaxID=1505087 RepID=A0A176ZAU0_9BRAD|nr:hypothetical protein AYJ54_37390 [Bradyrhizobium centrolobii]